MMLVLFFGMQLAASDTIYSSPAVRALVAAAAAANRAVPDSLRSYEANVESEVSLILQPSEGPEVAAQVEQMENAVRWLRTGEYEQRVIGYRVQAAGLTLSSLSYTRNAWTVPVLYGDRLALFFGSLDTSRAPRRSAERRRNNTIAAVHPLSGNREKLYRFTGGDTIALIKLRSRSMAVRRIHVEPADQATRLTTVFRGEIDIDADRKHIVRMRGRFLTIGPPRTVRGKIMRRAIVPVAYVELVNAEVNEQYWLPSYQRIEAQVSSVITGDARSVFRVISIFRNYNVNSLPVIVETGSPGDTLSVRVHRLTTAPSDSLAKYNAWTSDVGEASHDARATDFDDLAPQEWKPTGPPQLDIRATRFADVFRFNRVEGAYTGFGALLRMRDAFPGLTVRGTAGYAWTEAAAKGGALVQLRRRGMAVGLSAARTLDNTNDFRSVIDGGSTIPALLATRDDYDYVDRRTALAFVRVPIGNSDKPVAVVSLTAGPASDRAEIRRLTKGIFGQRYGFIQNRNVQPGRYRFASAQIDLHPEVSGEFIAPGVGAHARYDYGTGDIGWQRIEARITARRNGRIVTLAARADAGRLLGNDVIPPQQLFELGGTTGLPGYEYKEFAGDQAALGRGFIMASLPYFRVPVRVGRRWFMPAPSPALSFGAQAGWTGASNDRALVAIRALGEARDTKTGGIRTAPSGEPLALSRPAGKIRASVDVGLRFFGGALTVGFARPVDHNAQWRFLISGAAWQ